MFSAETMLLAVLTGGALVPVIGKIIDLADMIGENPLNKGQKRMLAVLLTVLLSTVTYALAVVAGYWPDPLASGNVGQSVVNDLVYISSLAFTSSQVLLSGFRSDTFQEAIGSANKYVSKSKEGEVKNGRAETDLSVLFK